MNHVQVWDALQCTKVGKEKPYSHATLLQEVAKKLSVKKLVLGIGGRLKVLNDTKLVLKYL